MSSDTTIQFRKAADRVWELALEYESKGNRELCIVLKGIATQLHDLAREKELGPNGDLNE